MLDFCVQFFTQNRAFSNLFPRDCHFKNYHQKEFGIWNLAKIELAIQFPIGIRNQESGTKNPNLKLTLILKQLGNAIPCWNLECRIQKPYQEIEQL
jgi:hypothetical protein